MSLDKSTNPDFKAVGADLGSKCGVILSKIFNCGSGVAGGAGVGTCSVVRGGVDVGVGTDNGAVLPCLVRVIPYSTAGNVN